MMGAMPNRFTAVPDGPVPVPSRPVQWVLPVADAFMVAMASRPASGSLRTTWVTPATLWLALAAVAGGAALAVVLVRALAGGGSIAALFGAIVCIALAAGAAAVVMVALDQRRSR